jgi:type VI secretion system secreted protein VgrG
VNDTAKPLPPVEYSFTAEADSGTHWLVKRFHLTETVSEPYQAVLEIAVNDPTASAESLLGSSCVATMRRDDTERRLCGIISAVERRGRTTNHVIVRITVVPALALAAHRLDTRIFQEKTAPDIVKKVLADALKPYDRELQLNLNGSYRTREYCVQYNETDLAFAMRLLEEEGITFTFDHSGEKEKLVIFDSNDANGDVVTMDGGMVPVLSGEDAVAPTEGVKEFTWLRMLTSTKFDARAFDWKKPNLAMSGSSKISDSAMGELPVYRPSSAYDGETLKQVAQTEDESNVVQQKQGVGAGYVTGFIPGFKFELSGHGVSDLDQKYFITRVVHDGLAPEAIVGFDSDSIDDDNDSSSPAVGGARRRPSVRDRYANSFTCVPVDQPFRPRKVTPQARIFGLLTAIVCGPGGEEIGVDDHGRIKVQFPWDRQGKNDDRSTCWIRVAQSWAGAGWGFSFVPRIGMEVVVSFIDGNPDKPLIVGCVNNGVNPTVYPLPGSKTKSGIRTNSSPGGGGFNELTFDDAAGSELVFHQAQKDLKIEVKNDKAQHVGHNEALVVDNDRVREIKGKQGLIVKKDDSSEIKGGQTLTVGGNRDTEIGGNLTETISGSHSETVSSTFTLGVGAAAAITVGGALAESVGGVKSESIGGLKTEQVGGLKSVAVVGSSTEKIGGNLALSVGKDWSGSIAGLHKLEVGKDHSVIVKGKIAVNAGKELTINGKKITLEAKDELILKCGDATITLKGGNVTIKGSKIKGEASGDVILKGSKVTGN